MSHSAAMTERLSTLGNFFRFYRHRSKLKQDQLAERIGVTKNTVSQIERGQQWPSMQTYLRLLDELKLETYDPTKHESVDGNHRRSEALEQLGLMQWLESLDDEELNYAFIRAWEAIEFMREMERRGLQHPFKRFEHSPLALLAPDEIEDRTKRAFKGLRDR